MWTVSFSGYGNPPTASPVVLLYGMGHQSRGKGSPPLVPKAWRRDNSWRVLRLSLAAGTSLPATELSRGE